MHSIQQLEGNGMTDQFDTSGQPLPAETGAYSDPEVVPPPTTTVTETSTTPNWYSKVSDTVTGYLPKELKKKLANKIFGYEARCERKFCI